MVTLDAAVVPERQDESTVLSVLTGDRHARVAVQNVLPRIQAVRPGPGQSLQKSTRQR